MTAAAELTWGIKSSLISYLLALPDARYLDEGGASLVEPDRFRFPADDLARWDAAQGMGVIEFRGAVVLAAHGGVLHIRIDEPWLEVDSEGARLSVFDDLSGQRLPLLDLDPIDVAGEMSARLRSEGTALFSDQYPVGTSMAPLALAIGAID